MLQVIDNFLPDQERQALQEVCKIHGGLRQQLDGDALFSWFPTDASAPPARSPHTPASQAVVKRYLPQHLLKEIDRLTQDHVGVEWWCNTNNDLDWHIDKDETFASLTGHFSLPLLSTVFYPHVSCAGGELLVADNEPVQNNMPGHRPSFRSVISIPPVRNRLVLFTQGILHRINSLEGERYSFALNVWDHLPQKKPNQQSTKA